MLHKTFQEKISQLTAEYRQETDPDLKKLLLVTLKHYYEIDLKLYAQEIEDAADRGKKQTTLKGKEQMMLDIFICHSSADVKIAKALIDLLRNALNIPAKGIRCTSVPGYKLPAGASVNEQLQLEIYEARSFIGLITEASLASTYVLFELGARWGAGKHLIPALAAGADSTILKEPLKSRNSVRCDIAADVYQLIEDIASALSITPGTAAAYQEDMAALVRESKAKKTQKPGQKKRSP